MPLNSDLREFIGLLNSNEVEYVIVGAFAVAWYGYPRYTADLDILIRPEAINAERILAALAQFGFDSLGISSEDLTTEGKINRSRISAKSGHTTIGQFDICTICRSGSLKIV